MSRAEILMNGVKCSNRLLELKRIHKWTDQEVRWLNIQTYGSQADL